jgi:hypothetical protein
VIGKKMPELYQLQFRAVENNRLVKNGFKKAWLALF